MNDDHFEELAALAAFDLLEGAEKAEFAVMLASDPALRARALALREASSALAYAAPAATPPPELKARILASAAAGAKAPAKSNVIAFPVLLAWAAAACFALAAAWMGELYLNSRAQTRALHDQMALADLTLRAERNQMEAERILHRQELADVQGQAAEATHRIADSERQITDLSRKLKSQGDLAQFKITTLASMLGNTPQALAVAVWDPSHQQGVLSVASLPVLAQNQDYQLWVIDPDYAAPISGGVFRVEAQHGSAQVNFHISRPINQAVKFAVSREAKGGSDSAKGPIVLMSQ
jgi:anti-sigma-K factor RskA